MQLASVLTPLPTKQKVPRLIFGVSVVFLSSGELFHDMYGQDVSVLQCPFADVPVLSCLRGGPIGKHQLQCLCVKGVMLGESRQEDVSLTSGITIIMNIKLGNVVATPEGS